MVSLKFPLKISRPRRIFFFFFWEKEYFFKGERGKNEEISLGGGVERAERERILMRLHA